MAPPRWWSDPDQDKVFLVDLQTRKVSGTVELQRSDEPGRSVEDLSGRVHVLLKGSGQLLTLSLADGVELDRRWVCAAPRGLAF